MNNRHKIVPTTYGGIHSGGHNGEYYYHCTECGKSDWIPHYGKETQLNFYNTPCIKKERKPNE